MNIPKVLWGPQMKAAIETEINIITVTHSYSTPDFSHIFENNMYFERRSSVTLRQA